MRTRLGVQFALTLKCEERYEKGTLSLHLPLIMHGSKSMLLTENRGKKMKSSKKKKTNNKIRPKHNNNNPNKKHKNLQIHHRTLHTRSWQSNL